jgi:hypothetical protein
VVKVLGGCSFNRFLRIVHARFVERAMVGFKSVVLSNFRGVVETWVDAVVKTLVALLESKSSSAG